ncbi:MAG: hypothetical protein ACYDA9_07695 [Terriglobia bacterium]
MRFVLVLPLFASIMILGCGGGGGGSSTSATPITPSVTWATPAAIKYGTALNSTQLNATASVAGSFSYSPAAGTILSAGTQTLTVTFTPRVEIVNTFDAPNRVVPKPISATVQGGKLDLKLEPKSVTVISVQQ